MNRSSALAGAIAVLIFAGCGPGESGSSAGESARVTRVIDGDTVVVERLGKTRLIGVDTPEKCGDDAATRFTEERLLDKVVQVEIGEEPKDRYDRTLAYLSRDEKMHNLALLKEGYARVLTIPPNDKYASEFEDAEQQARAANEGALATCDRNKRRAELRRQRDEDRARRRAVIRRERAQAARRAARAAARRERAAQRRREERALEREFAEPEEDSGGGGSNSGGGSSSGGGGSSGGGSCGPGDIDGDGDGVCNE